MNQFGENSNNNEQSDDYTLNHLLLDLKSIEFTGQIKTIISFNNIYIKVNDIIKYLNIDNEIFIEEINNTGIDIILKCKTVTKKKSYYLSGKSIHILIKLLGPKIDNNQQLLILFLYKFLNNSKISKKEILLTEKNKELEITLAEKDITIETLQEELVNTEKIYEELKENCIEILKGLKLRNKPVPKFIKDKYFDLENDAENYNEEDKDEIEQNLLNVSKNLKDKKNTKEVINISSVIKIHILQSCMHNNYKYQWKINQKDISKEYIDTSKNYRAGIINDPPELFIYYTTIILPKDKVNYLNKLFTLDIEITEQDLITLIS